MSNMCDVSPVLGAATCQETNAIYLHRDGQSPSWTLTSTINPAVFHCYVPFPRGGDKLDPNTKKTTAGQLSNALPCLVASLSNALTPSRLPCCCETCPAGSPTFVLYRPHAKWACLSATPLLDTPFPAASVTLASPNSASPVFIPFRTSWLSPLFIFSSNATVDVCLPSNARRQPILADGKKLHLKKTNTGRAAEQRSAVPCGKSEQRSDPQPSNPCLGAHPLLTPCPAVVKRATPDRLRWFSTAHMPHGLACGGFSTMPFKTRRVDRWPSRIGPGNALTLLDPDCLSLRLQQAMPETSVHGPPAVLYHAPDADPSNHAGLTVHLAASAQRSDACLGHTLAEPAFWWANLTFTVNIFLPLVTKRLRRTV